MTDCTICEKPAEINCDRCGHVRFCDSCYRKDVVECMCRECIIASRDCGMCADGWYVKDPLQAECGGELDFVCKTCFKGYCRDCVADDYDGRKRCPQCYDNVNFDFHEIDVVSSSTDLQPGDKIQIKREDIHTLMESVYAELGQVELEEFAKSVNPAPAPAVARRRRRQPFEVEVVPRELTSVPEEKPKEQPTRESKAKRPENVRPLTLPAIALHTTAADAILTAQTYRYLAKKYNLTPVFLEMIYSTKSCIVGSFTLEIVLAERYHDSDLDIACTETASHKLETLLREAGYVCTVTNRKYGSMAHMNYVRHVVTWERPAKVMTPLIAARGGSLSRVQLVIMTDTDHVLDYIAEADLTLVQCTFNGREFAFGHTATLEKRGCVIREITDGNRDRIKKYHNRGFQIQVPLTDDMLDRI